MNDLLAAAIDYGQRGWPVFPLKPREKTPLVTHGFKDATIDADAITAWWKRWADANIGLATGHTFDVVDIDSPEALAGLVDVCAGRPMPWGPEVVTGKGWHLWHRPHGCGNRAGIIPGVDYRGRGGYVIAPPSVHPSGAIYRWGHDVDGPIGPDETLEPLPDWFVELLERPTTPQTAPRPATSSGTTPYGQRALESELGRLATAVEGTRNNTLVQAASRLGSLVGGREIELADVVNELLVVAQRIGLTEAEATATIESGVRLGLASPRTAA